MVIKEGLLIRRPTARSMGVVYITSRQIQKLLYGVLLRERRAGLDPHVVRIVAFFEVKWL